MSAKSRLDPAGLPALMKHLEKLLREPSDLRSDAIHGRSWTDAEKEAYTRIKKTRQAVASELRRCGLSGSGHADRKLIEAQFEAASRGLSGFITARCDILARLDEMHRMWAEAEPQAWAAPSCYHPS